MRIEFQYDENALRRAAMAAAESGLRQLTAAIQQVVDGVHATHAGHPVDEVQAELLSRWQDAIGSTPTDEQLTEWSQAISDGKRIEVIYDGAHQ